MKNLDKSNKLSFHKESSIKRKAPIMTEVSEFESGLMQKIRKK